MGRKTQKRIQKGVNLLVMVVLTGTWALPARGYSISQDTLRQPGLGIRAGDGQGKQEDPIMKSLEEDLRAAATRAASVDTTAARDGSDRKWNGVANRADWDDLGNLTAAKQQLAQMDKRLTFEALQVMAQIAILADRDLAYQMTFEWHEGQTPHGGAVEIEVAPRNIIHVYFDEKRASVEDVLAVLLDPANELPPNLRSGLMTLLDLYFPSVFAGENIGGRIEARLGARIAGLERYERDLKTVLGDYEEGSEDAQALQKEIGEVESRLVALRTLRDEEPDAARDGGRRIIDIPGRIASLEKSITTVETTLRNGKVDAREMERLSGQLRRLRAQVADLEVGKVLLSSLGKPISQSVINQAKKKPKIGEVEVVTYDLGFLANNLDRATAVAREQRDLKNYGKPGKSGVINVLLPYAVSPGEGGIPAAIDPEDIDRVFEILSEDIRQYSGDETLSLSPDRFLIVPHEKLWDFNGMNLYITNHGYGHSMTRLFMRKQLVEDLRIEELARKSTVITTLDIYTYDPASLSNNKTGVDHLGEILGSKPGDKVRITSMKVINIPEQAKAALEELRNALDALRKV